MTSETLQLQNTSDRYGLQMSGFYRMERAYEHINELLEEYKTLLERDITDAQDAATQMATFDSNLANSMNKE